MINTYQILQNDGQFDPLCGVLVAHLLEGLVPLEHLLIVSEINKRLFKMQKNVAFKDTFGID